LDIATNGDRIISMSESLQRNVADVIEFDNAIVFPGLINSHDHLDFNTFPQLGDRTYSNYVEWGNHIHQNDNDIIQKVLSIPKDLRVKCGLYKNLINGVTTVVNHGPVLPIYDNIITVHQDYHVLHSTQLEHHWKYMLNKPFKKKRPFVIHIGEGGDESSYAEIDRLRRWNLTRREIIGVHGIAMDEQQARHFKALVWCPASNFFLIGKTARIDRLKACVKVTFGTDSTLSAEWNIWEHLRLARDQNMVSDDELYAMLTSNAAEIWNIPETGKLEEGCLADLVVARKTPGTREYDTYFSIDPEDILLVMHKGVIKLFDATLKKQIKSLNSTNVFNSVIVNEATKYVWGNAKELIHEIRKYYAKAPIPFMR